MTPPRGKNVRQRLLGFHAPIAFFNTLGRFCDTTPFLNMVGTL
jgi:hypothetical protein